MLNKFKAGTNMPINLCVRSEDLKFMVSQNVIPSKKYYGGINPWVFTEKGLYIVNKLETSNQQPRTRDLLQQKLKDLGIPTAVHYPMPLHLQESFAYLGYKQGDFPICEQVSNEIMSLPMNPYVTDEEITYIGNAL